MKINSRIFIDDSLTQLSDHNPIFFKFEFSSSELFIQRTVKQIIDKSAVEARNEKVFNELASSAIDPSALYQMIKDEVDADGIPMKTLKKKTWKEVFERLNAASPATPAEIEREFDKMFSEFLNEAFKEKWNNNLKSFHRKIQTATHYKK